MYLEYWGFRDQPFGNAPNLNLFFHSSQHEEALIRLLYAVEHRKGVAMLTGEVGSGKTTISRVLMNRLPKDKYNVQTIVNPALNSMDFIRAILIKLDEQEDSSSKSVLLKKLHTRLAQNAEQGICNILIIDEAHLIQDQSSLEDLRMLLNMQTENEFLITLIILGQPPLLSRISTLKPLRERISIKYHLEPLSMKDTMHYVLFRLKMAGSARGIFTKESVGPLYKYAKGLPLRINNLSDRCLLIGMMRKARAIDRKIC